MLLQLHSGGLQSVDQRTPLANWDDLPTSGSLGGFTAMTSVITNGSFVVVARPNEKRRYFPQPRYRDSGEATETEHVRTRERLSGRTAGRAVAYLCT
jgi:hypothetical protein